MSFVTWSPPIGSEAVRERHGLNVSSATVRNEMAALEEMGYLNQPHTSAGRIPTAQAYRYYVDQISGKAEVSPADQDLISGALQGTVDLQEFLQRTSHVLSLVSSGVGVATGSITLSDNGSLLDGGC